MGQENPDKNAHISTVNIAVLPSLCDTMSLSSFPIYLESSTHPLSELTTLRTLSSSMKSIYCFRKLIFLWLAIIFSPIWMSKQCSSKWYSSLPSPLGSLFWNQCKFCCVFQDDISSLLNEGLVPQAAWMQPWGTRASFRGTGYVNSKCEHFCHAFPDPTQLLSS